MNPDEIRMRHMLDSAREALQFVQGRMRADLDKDRMLVLSLVKLVEIIGEAAGKVRIASQEEHGEIPWHAIVAMRNRLIHAYFDIDLDRVWDTVTDDLPPLVNQLKGILASTSL